MKRRAARILAAAITLTAIILPSALGPGSNLAVGSSSTTIAFVSLSTYHDS
jgi:hypothetical protein